MLKCRSQQWPLIEKISAFTQNYSWHFRTFVIRNFWTFTQKLFLLADFHFYQMNLRIRYLYFYCRLTFLSSPVSTFSLAVLLTARKHIYTQTGGYSLHLLGFSWTQTFLLEMKATYQGGSESIGDRRVLKAKYTVCRCRILCVNVTQMAEEGSQDSGWWWGDLWRGPSNTQWPARTSPEQLPQLWS